jgi:ADP-heptose:LPS heptosyltransferase
MSKLKSIEHWFKRQCFALFSGLLKRKQEPFTPLDGNHIRKVLFLRPEKIGDMVISLPVFDGLKQRFPHIKISILASPKNIALISQDPRFDRIFLYQKNLFKDIQELRRIRREQFDCVVDMICNDSVTALFLSQLAAPGKPRIGVGKTKYRDYYDYNYDHRRGNTGHIIENTLKLLDAFGIDGATVSGYAPPYLPEPTQRRAAEIYQSMRNGSASLAFVGYNLSAGSPTRVWAEENSRQLIQNILKLDALTHIVLFVMPSDRDLASRLHGVDRKRIHIIPSGLNLLEATALIAHLNVLISPDTSLVHIARRPVQSLPL